MARLGTGFATLRDRTFEDEVGEWRKAWYVETVYSFGCAVVVYEGRGGEVYLKLRHDYEDFDLLGRFPTAMQGVRTIATTGATF